MTKVAIFRDPEGNPFGFNAAGHCGKGYKRGGDICCAAVSAITQTACVGLEKYAQGNVTIRMEDGYLDCRLDRTVDSDACRAILETMILGLLSFGEGNPGNVEIINEEVQ